jgi:hypothetical protein
MNVSYNIVPALWRGPKRLAVPKPAKGPSFGFGLPDSNTIGASLLFAREGKIYELPNINQAHGISELYLNNWRGKYVVR